MPTNTETDALPALTVQQRQILRSLSMPSHTSLINASGQRSGADAARFADRLRKLADDIDQAIERKPADSARDAVLALCLASEAVALDNRPSTIKRRDDAERAVLALLGIAPKT